MRLNLDKQFLNLNGEPLAAKMDEILANVLAMSTIGKPAKMITWAVNLTNDGEIEVDKYDVKFLSEFIENSPALTNLVKAQLLERIEKAEVDCTANYKDDDIEDIERALKQKLSSLR